MAKNYFSLFHIDLTNEILIHERLARVKFRKRRYNSNLQLKMRSYERVLTLLSERSCLLLINFPLFKLPGHLKLNHLICIVLLSIGSAVPTTNGHA